MHTQGSGVLKCLLLTVRLLRSFVPEKSGVTYRAFRPGHPRADTACVSAGQGGASAQETDGQDSVFCSSPLLSLLFSEGTETPRRSPSPKREEVVGSNMPERDPPKPVLGSDPLFEGRHGPPLALAGDVRTGVTGSRPGGSFQTSV